MEQELKQRLIGAAVITALAAIFVPMLFDDPVEETEKRISALKLPEPPAKIQDVEMAPLPEKLEDVTPNTPAQSAQTSRPAEAALPPAPVEALDERNPEPPKPRQHPPARETQPASRPLKAAERAVVAEDDFAGPGEAPVVKPAKPHAQPPAPLPSPAAAAANKAAKTVARPAEPTPPANTQRTAEAVPAPTLATGTRLYLNVGSFSHRNNASTLEEKLKQQGFAASIKEATTDKGPVYRVRIGPFADKARLQTVRNQLTQNNISSFVAADE